jgi:hypothetical protein
MKTTRLILAIAAALSLGLAVFANVRAKASASSTVNADELITSSFNVDAVTTGTPVADDNCPGGWDTDRAPVDGVKVACNDRLGEANHS